MRTAPAVTPEAMPATALFSSLLESESIGGAFVDVELEEEDVLDTLLDVDRVLFVNVVELDVDVGVDVIEVGNVVDGVVLVVGLDVGLEVGLVVDKASVAVALNCDSSD